MKSTWQFTIEYDPNNKPGILSNHIFVQAPGQVEQFGELANIPVGKSDSNSRRVLKVELSEQDPKLNQLVLAIQERCGYKPSPWFVTPLNERGRFYTVRKIREYSNKDLDQVPFLHLDFAAKAIATQMDGVGEQVEKEIYVAEADQLQNAKTQFGTLAPFHGLCVAEPLGRQIEEAGVRGLLLEPVVVLPEDRVRKRLLKLSSTCVAPRSLLPVVNEQGHPVEPNTEWACYLDDGGYHPHEFKYRKANLEQFRDVDIAVSYERTGVTKARAYRWCIVSQRFRQVMAELKVPGVRYAPVRFVS